MGDGGSDYECDQANNVRMSVVSSAVTRLARWVVAALVLLAPLGQALAAPCDIKNNADPFIEHDLGVSYCELCGYGYVTIVVSNPYSGATMTNLTVVEDLRSSGLTYAPTAPTPIRYSVNGGSLQPGTPPTVIGSELTWTATQIPELGSLTSSPGVGNNGDTITIVVAVAIPTAADQEDLVSANRTIEARVSFDTDSMCTDSPQSATDTLPLREPVPSMTKTGWNYDAGQREGSATVNVYGNSRDDVVWRIQFGNSGRAGLQDLKFDDLMDTGNIVINYACPTAAEADAVANNNGTPPPGSDCVSANNNISNFIVTNPFGNMGTSWGNEVDVLADGGSASVYLVGRITANGSCVTSQTNTAENMEWGCQVDTPAGGITSTSTGVSVGDAVARLYTEYGDTGPNQSATTLTVNRAITGTNTSQPVGSKGLVTITITNNTAGTVKNIKLTDTLPPEYVIDPTYWTSGFTKTLQESAPTYAVNTITPQYGSYAGMIDRITWTNPAPNTLSTNLPAGPLGNVSRALEFTLTSTTSNPADPANQVNLLRHGDVVTVTFPIVLIRSSYYDKVADLDVRPEVTADGTDPDNRVTLSNRLTVEHTTLCAGDGTPTRTFNDSFEAFPEDLDVDIGGTIFILTNNPAQPLPLPVTVTNNGGHDARDYHLFVTFGATMQVQSAPDGCSAIVPSGSPLQPAPWKTWVLPVPIPQAATVYHCTLPATIPDLQAAPTFNFLVIKTADPARLALDDLSFRADVVGEITLWNGTLLWFPTPTARPDGETDQANNYSLDGVRARVIGYNLLKSQVGLCTENNIPPPASPDQYVQIGEECTFHIETGGWFGFLTPGFNYIAVQNITVYDQMPDGQGYLRSTDPNPPASTSGILGISLNPAGLAPLQEAVSPDWINWSFNQVVPDQRITVRDEWFRVDISSRLLNDQIDVRAAPNLHAALSRNTLISTFQAVFDNIATGEELYDLDQWTVGYPVVSVRRIDLRVTEPRITVNKTVCNEELYGTGTACSNFVTSASNGDARNTYIYRVRLTNQSSANGVTRAPAYDITTTDILDASDLADVLPFEADGLDNDGDGLIDGADTNGEGTISDNDVKNGVPARLGFSYTHSNALLRLNPGQSVTFYYRVDFDDDAAPQQQFINSASATYDSLAGEFGNQSTPQRPNSDIGGARFYTSAAATATVQVIPVVTQPKTITRRSATTIVSTPQAVSIGEEVEYQLVTQLPVALLRNFVIRDELPAGIRCTEAPAVNLDAAPYSAAGFQPGGTITPTCTDNLVEWNFGNQRITQGTTNNYYDFAIRFIARVDNSAANNNGTVIRNGGGSTNVSATYVNQTGTTVTLPFGVSAIEVREPVISLTKAFSVANADASDVLTVTVTARNTGNATAYNLQVLDDLTGTKLTYLGSLGGSDPPDVVNTIVANRPIFSWNSTNPDFAIAPGATITFSFQVRVDTDVEPQELLDNTLQARWQSLPGQTTALNSTGLIGPDGSLTGLRNGAVPNLGDPINDYETTATASATVPPLATSKTDLSPATVPTIGAYKQFQIEILLPEGVSNNVSVSDNLAASGIGYMLANNATYGITYSLVGIASINPSTPDEGKFVSVPADGATGTAVWNIGTVVTATENDTATNAVTPAIRITYYARVQNDLNTDAGDTLQNTVAVSYRHGETGVTQTVTATAPPTIVVEPRLTLGKVLSNVTAPGNAPVVGDVLEYTVVLTNTTAGPTAATAFDVTVVDTLPANVELNSGFTPTATIGNGTPTPVAGFIATPAGAPTGPLVWGRGNGDGSLDIPASQSLTLTYRATVRAVDPAGVIENGVRADWTSLNDDNPYERTGTGCPSIIAPNDYCVGPVIATTTGIQPLRFEKAVFNVTTGQAQPEPSGLLPATPGDLLRYTIRVQNTSARPLTNLDLTDELDRLNAPAAFQSLTLPISITGGGGTDYSSATGGAKGTGLVDVRNISLGAAGGADTATIQFETRLVPVIVNGTTVYDQAQIFLDGDPFANSDDRIVNGPQNPAVIGDDDPTPVRITSAPAFRVLKVSVDITGDPAVLNPGDTLRYTITVKNVGTENATGVSLRDQIPANTTYVANSTRLNGTVEPDPVAGTSVLESGFQINAPEDTTAGAMRADATATTANVATVTFDVVINAGALNGTVISNQGFVNGSGSAGPVPEQPSDDPATPAVNDPTRDVVGNLPMIYALKTVQIQTDGGTIGQVDVGDVLRYTFTITNFGAQPATGVMLSDSLPNNTTYVAGSFQLNGLTVAGAAFPPDPAGPNGGIAISSSDRTPPLPAPGAGTLSVGGTATAMFDAQVSGVPSSNPPIISNQGTVASNELFPQLTDADGNPDNGYQPTQIVVGNAQALVISKQVAVVGGGAALVGKQLEYAVTVRNISTVAATNVVITDILPVQVSYVAGSGTLNGASSSVSYDDPTRTITANHGALARGASTVLRFRVTIDSGTTGDTITNTAQVTWNTPTQTASASVAVDIGGIPGSGMLNGRAWHDANFDNIFDSTELKLAGWSVQVYANGSLLGTVLTDTNGQYMLSGLAPNSGTSNQYELRFRAPGAGANTAPLGLADSVFTNSLQRISGIIVPSGSNLQNLNLPIDPDGVVYNSALRTPVAGSRLTLALPAASATASPTPVAASCFDDPAQQNQVTLASGYYKFDLNFSDASCQPGVDYLVLVNPPAAAYATPPSAIIPPTSSASTPAYSVPLCLADAVVSTAGVCEAQASEFAPPTGSSATTYYLHVNLSNGTIPGQSQLFNNHIPVDPKLSTALSVSKTSPLVNVTRAQLVPYTITIRNTLAGTLPNLAIVDTLPPGFKYIVKSARLNGSALEPVLSGRNLRWEGVTLAGGTTHTLKLLLVVGAGVSEGEYVNRAQVFTGGSVANASGVATATVRVIPDPTFDCTDIIGKVFNDTNANGYQDKGETGLGGARVVSARGLIATTDQYGRYHITCAVVPNENRGSNYILKLDERSLPSGYRTTTENPLVKRVTRGKMMKYNFGAAVHRVVRLDISDAVFEPKTTEMRPQWVPRIAVLLAELKKSPSVLRLSYLADVEEVALAKQRLDSVKREVAAGWKKGSPGYVLSIETEIYWRRGAPPDRRGLSNE